MEQNASSCRFTLQINSIEDFAAFVALVRGEALDADKLLAMTAALKKSTTALSHAEQADAGKQHT